jgi:tight adherence protein C
MTQELLSVLLDNGEWIVYGSVFMSVVLATIVVASLSSTWSGVRRRAIAGSRGAGAGIASGPPDSLVADLDSGGILDSLLPASEAEKSQLRRFLNMAGYYGQNAPTFYQLVRLLTAVVLGLLTAFSYRQFFPNHPFVILIAASVGMTVLGYYFPKSLVSLRRDRLCEEHRQGFPDFLDLLVICVEAGIGLASAIEKVSTDLARSYPSLSRNLGFMSLELRAGRTTRDALENLGQRLGIEEARSFATLLQQSEELGSSLVQSLRVYSIEMRDKRMARAEEKANALPVKLVIPLGLCIFPVILGITLMPVAIRLFKALGI